MIKALLSNHALPLILLAALTVGPVLADTVTVNVNDPSCVSGTGQPDPYGVIYCAIEDAVDDLNLSGGEGDIVMVFPGTYTPARTIEVKLNGLSIIGPQADMEPRPSYGSTRTAGSAAEAIVDGSATLGNIFLVDADNIIINGFEIKNGTSDLVRQNSSYTGTTVKYNIVHQALGDEGIQLSHCTDGLIEYNHVYDTEGDGVNYASSQDSILQYNEIHDVGSEHGAIYIYSSTEITMQYNDLYEVTHSSKGHGIRYGRGGSGNGPCRFQYNTIHDVTGAGICIEDSDGTPSNKIELTGNEIHTVSLGPGTWAGIRIEESSDHIAIEDNEIYNNPLGINVTSYSGAPDATTINVTHNQIYNNTQGARNTGLGILDAEENWWGDASGPEDTAGTFEIDETTCNGDSTLDLNADGSGNDVGDNIDYCPWWINPTGTTATATPTTVPSSTPTQTHTATAVPTQTPTDVPTELPTEVPTAEPTVEPTAEPTDLPTEIPTPEPTAEPTGEPTEVPTMGLSPTPTTVPPIPTTGPLGIAGLVIILSMLLGSGIIRKRN